MKLHLIFSLCLVLTVVSILGQETEESQEDGRGEGRGEAPEDQRANRGCSLLRGCKEFTKDPFKIKTKISNLIGIKKNAKNYVISELKNIREKINRKAAKVNQIKQFVGDIIETKDFFVRQIPDVSIEANRAANNIGSGLGSAFNFLQGFVPTTARPAPTPRPGRPRFNSRFRFTSG